MNYYSSKFIIDKDKENIFENDRKTGLSLVEKTEDKNYEIHIIRQRNENGIFGEYNTLADLCRELVTMLKTDMEDEDAPLDEVVNYYQIKDENGNKYSVDCEYKPDKVYIVDKDHNIVFWEFFE